MEITIPEFPMRKMPDKKICLFIGRRGSGKSYCIKDLLYHKRKIPVAKVFSATESSNKFYSSVIPPIFIEHEFSRIGLHKFYKRQIQQTEKLGTSSGLNGGLLLLDDLQYSVREWSTDKNMLQIFLNGRHFGVTVIVALQYCLGLPPLLRSQADFIFIFAEPTLIRRRQLFEYFSTGIDDFKKFCDILDGCTRDFTCLVINNTASHHGTLFTEPLYYYRAHDNGDFRVCSDQAWSYSDLNYQEMPIIFDVDDNKNSSLKSKYKITLL